MSSPVPVRHLRNEPSKPITRLATDIPQSARRDADGNEAAPEETSLQLGAHAFLKNRCASLF